MLGSIWISSSTQNKHSQVLFYGPFSYKFKKVFKSIIVPFKATKTNEAAPRSNINLSTVSSHSQRRSCFDTNYYESINWYNSPLTKPQLAIKYCP